MLLTSKGKNIIIKHVILLCREKRACMLKVRTGEILVCERKNHTKFEEGKRLHALNEILPKSSLRERKYYT